MAHSKRKTAFSIIATLFAIAVFQTNAKADIYQHVDGLAQDIQTKTRLLLRETVHYRYTPQYRSLVQCTRNLNRLARHIHEVTHFEGNLIYLQADLKELAHEFYNLESLFDRIELSQATSGCSRIVGNTGDVKHLLIAIEQCILEMHQDVSRIISIQRRRRAQSYDNFGWSPKRYKPVRSPNPRGYRISNDMILEGQVPQFGSSWGASGLSLGSGSSMIQIRF
ncbi:MAG: hypothetical protein AAF939_20565 [Planctomycetota bacterium]